MGHHKQTMKPGFSLEVDNQAPLFTNTHAGWVEGTWQQKPIHKVYSTCRWQINHAPTKLQSHSFIAPCHVSCLGGALLVPFGLTQDSSQTRIYTVGPRIFPMLQLSKAHTELPCKVMGLHVVVDPHSCFSWLRKVHSTVCACVQATAWSDARGFYRRNNTFDFTRYSSWLLPMKAASETLFISASPSIVPRQHPPAVSCSSSLWLPWQSACGCLNLWNSFWQALLLISGMNVAQNAGVMFPNFRLQGLAYISEVVYCGSLQPSPFFSRVLQNFRVQTFPTMLPYRDPVMCHYSACQGQGGSRNVPPWMCWKPNTLTNVNVYHLHKITRTNHIYRHIRNT